MRCTNSTNNNNQLLEMACRVSLWRNQVYCSLKERTFLHNWSDCNDIGCVCVFRFGRWDFHNFARKMIVSGMKEQKKESLLAPPGSSINKNKRTRNLWKQPIQTGVRDTIISSAALQWSNKNFISNRNNNKISWFSPEYDPMIEYLNYWVITTVFFSVNAFINMWFRCV